MNQPPPARAAAIDLAHLARQTGGDGDLEREVLALFRQQCARLLPVIAAVEAGEQSRRAAHSLKGAALGVGAFAVAAAAERLEADARDVPARLATLRAAVAEAQEAIEALLAPR